MNPQDQTKQLLKILIGAAWLDGTIQTEERKYLEAMAKQNNLQEDAEVVSLLSGVKAVSTGQCYQWLEEYLGEHPKSEDYENLLEAVSGLVYSDGDIDIQEAEFLTKLQLNVRRQGSHHNLFDHVLQGIQTLYRKGMNKVN